MPQNERNCFMQFFVVIAIVFIIYVVICIARAVAYIALGGLVALFVLAVIGAAVLAVGAFLSNAFSSNMSNLVQLTPLQSKPAQVANLNHNQEAAAKVNSHAHSSAQFKPSPMEFESVCCPITQQTINEPASTIYGHAYEMSAIKAWVAKEGNCPMTKKRLTLD